VDDRDDCREPGRIRSANPRLVPFCSRVVEYDTGAGGCS
jgi:hypothetical protein